MKTLDKKLLPLSEIRLNEKYAHLYSANYEDNKLKEDSTPIIKRKTLFLDDYMKRAIVQHKADIIPPNCRYIEEITNGHIIIIEEPPAIRTINVRMNLEHEKKRLLDSDKLEVINYKKYDTNVGPHTFSLAFPYVIFMLYVSSSYECTHGKVFVRPARMSGLSDLTYMIPLTNISENQSVCFGDKVYGKHSSLARAIDNTIMVFWSAEFNCDYMQNYHDYGNTPILRTYMEWNYMSQENPIFVYNADWIKMENNLADQIYKMKRELHASDKHDTSYNYLHQLFYNATNSGKVVKTSSQRKHPLYYDICQSIFIDGRTSLNVGDTIKMHNGDVAYVDSFAGFMSGGEIRYILFDHNGRKFHMKHNTQSMKFLKKQIDQQRNAETATIKNGVVIKPGDIIAVDSDKVKTYRKVKYIRKSRGMEDEEIREVRLNDDYYISSHIVGEKLDIKKPKLYDINLIKNKEYLLTRDTISHGVLIPVLYGKYNSIDVINNQLTALFTTGKNESSFNLSLDTKYKIPPIINIENCKPGPITFRCGRKLYYLELIHTQSGKKPSNAWIYNGRLLYNDKFSLKPLPTIETNNFIKDNVFSIPGTDFDTTFEIGDKVIAANWKDPLDVLNIKTLIGFKHDQRNGNIYFILSDKNEKLQEIQYISGVNSIIYTGRIRKVTNKFKRLSVGMKIIANKSRIPAFPKKDINIITAIIIDSPHEPLILCSNGCTLWYSTVMNDFERITMRSKKWKTLVHAPLDMSKIKLQAGDIVNGQQDYESNIGYLLYNPSGSKTPRAIPLQHYSYPEDDYSLTLDKYFSNEVIFDCIPNPRVGTTANYVCGGYDFHGGVIEDPTNGLMYSFINERGDANVSSTCK